MLNQLLKFTLVSSLLLWLRPRWRGLLALVVFVLLVHILHGEYLSYVELSGNSAFLVWSYVLKWLALMLGVLAYFLLAVVGVGRRENAPSQPSILPDAQSASPGGHTAGDGFDFLREKKELQSKADKVLAGKTSR